MTKKTTPTTAGQTAPHEQNIVTQAYAAKMSRMSSQGMYKYIKDKNPAFVVRQEGKPPMIDMGHPEWSQLIEARKKRTDIQPVKKYKKQSLSPKALVKKLKQAAPVKETPIQETQTADPDPETKQPAPVKTQIPPEMQENPDFQKSMELALKAEIAVREQEISKAEIAKQKAMQEELKTLEMKRETAPIELVEFFFSFAENMIQRIYRRPHEINADLESLYMAGKKEMAVNKLIREMEAIVKDCQSELIEHMKQEGFKRRGKKS